MENRIKGKRMLPHKLPAEIYRALKNVVGEEWISQDRARVETYSKLSLDAEGFLKKHRKNPASIPACVMLPGRQVLTKEEFKLFPAHTFDSLNTLRQSFDMEPIER